jgi:hypothetical protein
LLWNRGVLSQGHVSLCQHDFVLKRLNLAQTRFSKGESTRNVVPEFAVEQAEFVPSTGLLGKDRIRAQEVRSGRLVWVVGQCVEGDWVVRGGGGHGAGIRRFRSVENVAAQSADRSRTPPSRDEMMDLETLRELQQRGRFFYEMFPGAQASEEWLRHRDQLEREHAHHSRSSPAATNEPTEKSSDSE